MNESFFSLPLKIALTFFWREDEAEASVRDSTRCSLMPSWNGAKPVWHFPTVRAAAM